MQPITIAAICIAAIAITIAALAMVNALIDRAVSKSLARDLIKEQEVHGNLKTAHLKLGSIYAEAEQFLAAERADHATTRATLATLIAKHSAAGRAGRQAQLAQAAERRMATTAALKACVEARV